MLKPKTDSKDRFLYFVEETPLFHRIHAAEFVTIGGDDTHERYKVGADGSYEVGYVELLLPEALFSGEATFQISGYVHRLGVKAWVRKKLHALADKRHTSNFM
jgi:hypothetical protein